MEINLPAATGREKPSPAPERLNLPLRRQRIRPAAPFFHSPPPLAEGLLSSPPLADGSPFPPPPLAGGEGGCAPNYVTINPPPPSAVRSRCWMLFAQQHQRPLNSRPVKSDR